MSELENSMEKILKEKFGFSGFRSDQKSIIESVLSGRSALALMPTGGGKSLCYQLPSFLVSDLVLVFTPLIALMEDQVREARQFGIEATYLSSTLDRAERERRYREISSGKYKLVFVTPERFRKEEFREALGQRNVSLLAVDEAHCISQWGHDFRPDYSRLGELREWMGNPVTLALTATATEAVQKDILKQLGIESAPVFRGGLERPNLEISVHDVYGVDEKVRGIFGLLHHAGAGSSVIIYFSLIQSLYKVSAELEKLGVKNGIYHGQLNAGERRRSQRNFIEGNEPVILATPAFGLGINKADVRMVIHGEMPNSLESYFQEIGRAGRDGKPAGCHLFYDQEDVSIQMEFIKWANPDAAFIKQVYHLIERGGPGLQDEGMDHLRRQLNFYNSRDFRVETAVNQLERWGSLVRDSSRLGFRAVSEPAEENLRPEIQASRLRVQNEKLLQMVQWATATEGCRLARIYEYFGAKDTKPCGHCDLCRRNGVNGGSA